MVDVHRLPWRRSEIKDAGKGWRYVDVADGNGDILFTTVHQLTDMQPIVEALDIAIAAVNAEPELARLRQHEAEARES